MKKNLFLIAGFFLSVIFSSCIRHVPKAPAEKVYSQKEVDNILAETEQQIHNQQVIIELLTQRLSQLGLINPDDTLKSYPERRVEKEVTGREKWQK